MVDGNKAAQTLLSWGTCKRGMCLYYVWLAYKEHGARADKSFPTALTGWHGSGGKHEGDRDPPPGVPVWWGKKPGNDLGDVVISVGDGRVVATDFPSAGLIGTATLDERQRQIGREYLGWTETILGAAIDGVGRGAPAVLSAIRKEKNVSYSIVPLADIDEVHAVSLVTGARVNVTSPFHVSLLQRVKKNENNDKMLQIELDIVRGYLTAINPPPDVVVDAQAIADALAQITQDVEDDEANVLVNDALTKNSRVRDPGLGGLDNRL